MSASAQQGESPAVAEVELKLAELRSTYHKESALAVAPLLQRYREDLLALENGCVARRDYEMAAVVRDERLKTEEQLASLAKQTPELRLAQTYGGGPVTLAAKEAEVSRGVIFNVLQNVLEGWQMKGATVSWALPFPLAAGGYQVWLEWACAPGSGGKLEIKENFHTLEREITSTGGWSQFSARSLGTLRLGPNASRLHLTATEVKGEGLFLLRAVKLIPVAELTQ